MNNFSRSFESCNFFHEKVEPKGKSIELSTFLKYDLIEVKKAPS